MTTIYDNDLRSLSDNELIYNISKKQVENEQPSFDEFINSLTPSKKKFAMNVIELFRRNVERKALFDEPKELSDNSMYDVMVVPKVNLLSFVFYIHRCIVLLRLIVADRVIQSYMLSTLKTPSQNTNLKYGYLQIRVVTRKSLT